MRKLALFVCGFTVATAVLIYVLQGVCWLLCPVLALAASAFFLPKNAGCRRVAIFLLGAALGTAWCSGYTTHALQGLPTFTEEPQSFSACVTDYPTALRRGSCVNVELVTKGKPSAVLFYDGEYSLSPGDLVTGEAVWQRTAPTEQGDDLYNISRGILLRGTAEGELAVQKADCLTLREKLTIFAGRLKENLYAVFPADSAGYFTSLTVGDRSGMSYAFRNDLALVGLYHAVSLSGMHISILMSAIVLLCWGRKRLAAVFGVPLIVLFCLLSGANPATIRAVFMQCVLLLSLFISREYDSVTALCAALLFLLVQNPWSLSHWGLQLSFMSSAGILLLMPKFMEIPIRVRLLRSILTPVFVTVSATVFSAPLMSAYFGMNSLVAVLTNLLALWSVTLSFVGGIAVSLLGFLSRTWAYYAAYALRPLHAWLRLVTDAFARLPFAAVYDETPLLLAWSYLAYLLPVAALWLKPKWYLAVPGCLAVLTAAMLFAPKLPDGITMLDVGQGQCILLTKGDHAVMVDCGAKGDDTGELAARHLLSRGITKLDALVITHFDSDHCDGVAQLLHRIAAQRVCVPTEAEESALGDEIMAADAVEILTAEEKIQAGAMEITIFPAIGGESDNDRGLSVLASAEECDMLITGDMSTSAEARLVMCQDLPDLEILAAGHHGSAESTGGAILDGLRPETVLISVGENGLGHPHPDTMARIAASGALAYTTMENGNLIVGW